LGRLVATLGLIAALTVVTACRGHEQTVLPPATDDPVAVAIAYRQGTVVCDEAHARRALSLVDGWTGYSPRDARTAAGRAAVCREMVAPGTTVRGALVSRTARRAVVRVRTTSPDGGGTGELVRLRRHGDRWWISD
jgi:hypothetical protein